MESMNERLVFFDNGLQYRQRKEKMKDNINMVQPLNSLKKFQVEGLVDTISFMQYCFKCLVGKDIIKAFICTCKL